MISDTIRTKILVSAMPVLAILAMPARAQEETAPVPRVAGPFTNIYLPQADLFTLPTVTTKATDGSITYKQGETYQSWRTNDHSFIRDGEGRWHCFGITKPWMAGDNGHAGEGLCFHAISPKGSFGQSVAFQSWRDLPKVQIAGCGWAPHAFRIGAEYSLVSSSLGLAKSTDLLTWTDGGRLKAKGSGRDSHVFFWNETYYLLRCAGNGISASSSENFINWSEPVLIYKPKEESYQTESPFMIHYDGWFYLFWTLWDQADPSTSGNCPRSYVHASKSPMDFRNQPVLAEITVHAPEIIQAEDGSWFISSADHPHRGISVAPLRWETQTGTDTPETIKK